ncbi:MAG TPA: alpha/beta hydrolase [Cyanobacteria bacterium UBA8803]|nr:alpha/beta hydrolase [Cyanobacteria bacterium UBA9273]HBL61886.1 alpha/beta hydrolase [Cyanobacteria bacterium UBA8803]
MATSPIFNQFSIVVLPIVHCSLKSFPITHSKLPITHYPLPITNYPLPITHYLYRDE